MKKTKVISAKRSFFMSVLSLVLCFAMLIGTTWAWFTDEVTSGTNRIVAGNLDVDLVMYDTAQSKYVSIAKEDPTAQGDIFKEADKAQNSNATLWEPGKTQYVFLGVQNKGNLALKYQIVLDVVDDPNNDGKGLAHANTDGTLQSSLEYVIIDGATYEANNTAVQAAKWAGLTAMTSAQKGDVLAQRYTAGNGVLDEIAHTPSVQNETDYFLLAVHMKEDAGNEYQEGDVIINVNIVATQKDAESDSFGPDYDLMATMPTVPLYISGKGSSKGLTKDEGDLKEDGAAVSGDAVMVQIQTSTSGSSGSGTLGTIGSASVPKDAAKDLLTTQFTEDKGFKPAPAAGEGQTVNTEDVLVLTLNVDTLSADTKTMAIDVTMLSEATRTVTVKQGDETVSTDTQKNSELLKNLSQPVKVSLNLVPGLDDVKVTHNHEEGGSTTSIAMVSVEDISDLENGKFHYNKANGVLTILTDKFSVFDISYLAPELCKIGSTPYVSLEAAVEAAEDGDVIVLCKDITGATINKDVTISSNGAGLTAAVAEGKTLTVKDGTFQTFAITGEGNCVVTGGTFSNDPSTYVVSGKEAVQVGTNYVVKTILYWKDYAAEAYEKIEGDVIEIATAEQLAKFAKEVNEGLIRFSDKTVKLTADINLAGKRWTPIGGHGVNPQKTFAGTFDGQGHKITGLTIAPGPGVDPGTEGLYVAGLFGFIGETNGTATVKNLVFEHACVAAQRGGVAIGQAEQGSIIIENIRVSDGTLTIGQKSGGIIGYVRYCDSVSITNCSVDGLTFNGYNYQAGGIIGDVYIYKNSTIEISNNTVKKASIAPAPSDNSANPIIGEFRDDKDAKNDPYTVTVSNNSFSDCTGFPTGANEFYGSIKKISAEGTITSTP